MNEQSSDTHEQERTRNIFVKFIRKLLHLVMRNIPGSYLRVRILKLLGADIQGNIFVGQEFFVFDADRTDLLSIGKDVGIGPRVTILLHSDPWPSPFSAVHPKKTLPVIINKGVWVGAGAIILPGVTIGEYSVVGAGAVVIRDVPPHSMVAGVPAKVVRTYGEDVIGRFEGSHLEGD